MEDIEDGYKEYKYTFHQQQGQDDDLKHNDVATCSDFLQAH
jgi:hypothetical protein